MITTAERVAQLQAAHALLATLMKPEEQQLYPALVHLDDLIHDLRLDLDEEAA